VVDAEGNLVSATLSINLPFGSGFIAPGTGVLLNNEMDDFTLKPGQPNSYGLVGSNANAIAPGKRMSSSMSPSFVERKDRVMAVGTPGGSRIITMVMEGVMAFAEGADAKRVVTRPRMHHQYLPDEIVFESGALTDDEKTSLRRRGHALREVEPYGNMQAIIWNRANGRLDAASDPRGIGLAEERTATRRPEPRSAEPVLLD
jgi:gamma-glutamyltranspeptidase/glutathione hydrolase